MNNADEHQAAVSEKVEEYRAAIVCVALCGKLLAQHDLPALLAAIERAEAVGPIVDPTLYREKAKAMEEDREAMRAALPLRTLFAKASL